MATRSELKTQLRAMLGLSSDDPLASDEVLNPILNQANQSVVAAVARAVPDALATNDTVTLSNFAGPTPAEVFQIRVVRDTDVNGTDLTRVPFEELASATSAYAVTGVEAPFSLWVSDDVTASVLYLGYTHGAGPNDLDTDEATPDLLPSAYHDVVALEAGFAVGLGGEQRRPPEFTQRWIDRKAELIDYLLRVAGPGPASRTRMAVGQGEWP